MKLIKCSEDLPEEYHEVLWKDDCGWHNGYLMRDKKHGRVVMLECSDLFAPVSHFKAWAELPGDADEVG